MGSFTGVQKIAAKKIGITYEDYLVKIESEKWCTTCKSWQPRTSFNIDKSRGDGLAAKCHNCIRVKEKKCWKGRVSTFKGKRHSDETRRLIGEKVKAAQPISPRLGKKHSMETRKKISPIPRERGAKGERWHS